MKTMLVPVDFSETSKNSLQYAVKLAEWLHTELILFHVIYTPAFISDEYSQIVLPAFTLKEDCEKELESMCNEIRKQSPGLTLSYVCANGVPADEILQFAAKKDADIIVAGIQGVGYVTERWIGSTASVVMKRAHCPVIVVDREHTFIEPRKMVLATDFEDTGDPGTFQCLGELVGQFKAHLYVLHVHEGPVKSGSARREQLKEGLGAIPHSFCYAENSDVRAAINEFVDKLKMDLVVMIPRHHGFIERIFHESHTTRMAFHSRVPVLTLPV